ncbi:MAG: hypothetical protein R6V32_02150 [Bacteroidales bacterium]
MPTQLTYHTSALQPHTIDYATNGNIDIKSDAGEYDYNASKVHAVEQMNNPTDAISTDRQDITYTSFHKPGQITHDEQVYDGEHEHKLDFQYGPENNRKKTVLYQDDQPVKTRIFAGNYEKEILPGGTEKEYNYISGPNGLIAVFIVENGTGTLYYTVTDHLGSIVQLIDENGTVIDETNYSPCSMNFVFVEQIPMKIGEMLPKFDLIHMPARHNFGGNGRMYDLYIIPF